jgi:hypothetical protein
MTRKETSTLKVFSDDQSRKRCIETLAGCCFVLMSELKNHCDVDHIPEEVGYHIGLAIIITGALLGRVNPVAIKLHDLTISDADYDQKLELVVESLISLRELCREKRRSEGKEF